MRRRYVDDSYLTLLRQLDVCQRYGIEWATLTFPGHDLDVLDFPPQSFRVTNGMHD